MINWLKHNWALVLLILISINYLKNKSPNSPIPFAGGGASDTMMTEAPGYSTISNKMMPVREVAPTDSSSRMAIQNSSLSLQVKDVATQIKSIESLANSFGGYLVNSTLSSPESAANGFIPKPPDVTAHTKTLQPGEKEVIEFVLPAPGDYVMICTFPGHGMMMNGVIHAQ